MGGSVPSLDVIATGIWSWCYSNNIWLSPTHVPGVSNTNADVLSRRDLNKELHLLPEIFSAVLRILNFMPNVDLFASNINTQLPCYVSWKHDPHAFAIDAFSISWTELDPYIFPPFSLISRVLKKVLFDRTSRAILIAPLWKAQPWFPLLLRSLVAPPIILPAKCLTPTFIRSRT